MTCARFAFLFVLLGHSIAPSSSCPTMCVCKWKNGKQTVECMDKGWLIIPEGMDTGTQVLEFSGNNLRTLHTEKFHRMDLIHLQRIFLARCQIAAIENRTFAGLTNLVELDLSSNVLDHVPSSAFRDCPSLMRLSLSGNPIRTISREAFAHLLYLNTLELNDCQINQIDSGAFDGLGDSLERLRLSRNALTTIEGASGMPAHLQEVELQGNVWECDCRMLEMRLWLENYELPTNVAPICARPTRLAKRPIKSIPLPEFACLPDISPAKFHLEIAEGRNVSLQCEIKAIPEAHVSWSFHDQLLPNDTTMFTLESRLIYYTVDGGGTGAKRSELFIFNTNQEDNGTFVCIAENPAGVVRSNFSIRIVLTSEPHLPPLAQLPFEFVLIIASATGVSLIIICVAFILSLIKCLRRSSKSHSTKDSLLLNSVEEFSEISKDLSQPRQQQSGNQVLSSMSPVLLAAIQLRSSFPPLEQNPDVISDAESMSIGKRLEADGEAKRTSDAIGELAICPPPSSNDLSYLQPVCYPSPSIPDAEPHAGDLYRMSADVVHLNPAGLLNVCLANDIGYRTLPYNRTVKRQPSLQEQPSSRRYYQRDAADVWPTLHPHRHRSYEEYHTNLRHTADGYPVRGDSDQETQFSDTESMRSCCSAPTTLSANVRTCVVAAQTQTDITTANLCGTLKPSNRSVSGAVKIAETLTESPDEGYEGEEGQTKV